MDNLLATKNILGKRVLFYKGSNGKKYKAVILNSDGSHRTIQFGDSSYQQYKDKVAGIWASKNHGDKKRRELYRTRHAGEGDPSNGITAGYLSWHYLW